MLIPKESHSRELTNWNINLLLDTVQVHHCCPGLLQSVDGSMNPPASQWSYQTQEELLMLQLQLVHSP